MKIMPGKTCAYVRGFKDTAWFRGPQYSPERESVATSGLNVRVAMRL